MRILLAIDGSAAAGVALELVDRIRWPDGSAIRVAAALERGSDLVGLRGIASVEAGPAEAAPTSLAQVSPADRRDIETSLVRRLDDALDAAALELAAPGRTVDRILLRGRAASAVVREAESFDADLVVAGHRGHGRLETMLLGSVSAEIVDHAPCPVLVARKRTVASLLLAADGSAGANKAADFLVEYPIFAGVPTRVVSVAEVGMPWSTGMSPGIYDQVIESYNLAVEEARRECTAIAGAAASRLADAGYETVADAREGDPATEIVADAKSHDVDVVVTGTRGHTGLARLILGSTARKILVNAPCSVLVVRENMRVRHSDEAKTGSAVSA